MDNAALSELIDAYGEARKQRLAKKHEVDALEVIENKLKVQVVKAMIDAKASSHGAKKYGVNYKRKIKPVAGDWSKIYGWIAANDGFDILQKRLTDTAVQARWDDKIIIPGIIEFPVDDITVFTP